MSFISQWIYILSLSLWVGGMVFFSFFTTPTAFSALPKEMASSFITQIFPRYYMLGYVCGGGLVLSTLTETFLLKKAPWIRIILLTIMVSSTLYAGLALRPQVHQTKIELQALEEGSQAHAKVKERFDKQHRLSVILNLISLVAGLFLIGILAFRLRT
ncbi:MAG: DUF4149 domain-containing protein [Deltaproteobacteria bacterium]|nr:DUF4149 domain-containing protein [Deltaproteobacteria bacterium]